MDNDDFIPDSLTVKSENGATIECKLLKTFDFKDQKYAILMELDNLDSDDKILVRIITKFEHLEEQEFKDVVDYLEGRIQESLKTQAFEAPSPARKRERPRKPRPPIYSSEDFKIRKKYDKIKKNY